jgi:hypothetical protein
MDSIRSRERKKKEINSLSNRNFLDLQVSVQNKLAFTALEDYIDVCQTFLQFIAESEPTRIISPTHHNYVFYQYDQTFDYKITRPLNTDLFIEDAATFQASLPKFMDFLAELRQYQELTIAKAQWQDFIDAREIDRIIYTLQQSIGCIGDSFPNPNQSRKRIGQLFENLIRLIIQQIGLECQSRTITIPIPGYPGYQMQYELDVVFSRDKAILTSEAEFIHATEIVGSVKTTSKDRIDKIFLDKYLLTKLIGRDVPVIAIFLHDVQRAQRGNSLFGINSTFKTNHFLGYTVALNKLDGVYYVDPRPEMTVNQKLREQVRDFQQFLIHDIWTLSQPH